MDMPSLHGHGWIVSNGSLRINLCSMAAAPAELLAVISCSCKGSCDTQRCSCKKNGWNCTEACKCQEGVCSNRMDDDESDDEVVD